MRNSKKIVHSSSFITLKRALRLARQANRPHSPPLDELVEQPRQWNRRDFLQTSLGGFVSAAIGASLPYQVLAKPSRITYPKIVIVGAGIAGLNAAYTLKKAGVYAEIYESSARSGGRIFTVKDVLAPGLVNHLGGSFINTHHADMLGLVKEFGLELLDLDETDDLLGINFFHGKQYSEKQLAKALQPLEAKMEADTDALEKIVDFEHEGGGKRLDSLSLAEYFDQLGATGWLRDYLEVSCTSEFGLETAEQSALNFLLPVMDESEIEDYERYLVKGGSARITDELAQRLQGQINYGHTLEAIRSQGSGFNLTFQKANAATVAVKADVVILTIPFSVLRHLDIQVELPAWKRNAIDELGYGMNAKVIMGFHKRIWEKQGYSGEALTDGIIQETFEDTILQPGDAGGITFYFGGEAGKNAASLLKSSPSPLLTELDKLILGTAKQYNGRMTFWHWPSFPLSLGSYSCYRPGQWTTIAGSQFKPVGNLFFAGEHCSSVFWGYMNGAAETGRKVAKKILASLK
jgi:monoamine oxidase